MFSFAYITPGEFQIVPMDDLDPELFSKMSALKKQNKALKVMVALGGWTFNDPGPTQRVFHEVASSRANRAKFIGNLLSFLRQYAYDGVDFDWVSPEPSLRTLRTPRHLVKYFDVLTRSRNTLEQQIAAARRLTAKTSRFSSRS